MISTFRPQASRVLGLCITLCWVGSAATMGQSPPTMDGNLSDCNAIVLQIQSQNLRAVGIHQLDNFVNVGPILGPQGFCDDPLNETASPLLTGFGQVRMFSPINVGDFYWIYKPDSDGIIDPPSADDSYLAVGANIANGDGDVATSGPLVCTDRPTFEAPVLPSSPRPGDPGHLPWLMVPFDCDGNGDPGVLGFRAQCRWFPDSNSPVDSFDEVKDAIDLAFRFCQPQTDLLEDDRAAPDFEIYYSQTFDFPTQMQVFIKGIETTPYTNFANIQAFPPIAEAAVPVIMDGGDGICSTSAVGDDIQFIPKFANVRAPGVLILPGPNGVINSVPGGDDILTTTSPITLRGIQPNFSFPDGRSNNDIEIYVPKIDSAVTKALWVKLSPAPPPPTLQQYYATYIRYVMATSRLDLRSESSGDLSGEDTMSARANLPVPGLEATKEVRCVQTGNPTSPNPWSTNVTALPGSVVEFKVSVENTSNIPLSVTLTDVLQTFGTAGFTVNPSFLQATLFRPANGAGQTITAANAASFGLNPTFFTLGGPGSPGFLGGIPTGAPRNAGILQGVQACAAITGDRLELVFRVTFAMPDCNGFLTVDAKNSITATGVDPNNPATIFTDAPGIVPADPNNGIDTLRERTQTAIVDGGNGLSQTQAVGDDVQVVPVGSAMTPGGLYVLPGPNGVIDSTPAGDDHIATGLIFDDGVVTVNLLCRSTTLVKEVQYCTDCNNPASCGAFATNLAIPSGPFPLCVRYRYTLTNNGEVDESYTLTDDFLCADVTALQLAGQNIALVSCDVCPSGATGVLAKKKTPADPNSTAQKFCTVRFGDLNALNAFLAKDDPPNPPRTCDALPLPGQGNIHCYSNCAHVVSSAANLDGVCDDGPQITQFATAQVCGCCAQLDVTKQVVCLDPNTGAEVLPYQPNVLTIPGSRVRFKITVTNTTDQGIPIRQFRITDTLAGGASCITVDPNTAKFSIGATNCPVPATFNVTGTPYIFDPNTCIGGPLQPAQVLTITFDARIPASATSSCTIANQVLVEGAPSCSGVGAIFFCGSDTDTATVTVRNVGLSCLKRWSVTWDKNANCVIDPNDGFIDYSNFIDLGTADGGQAIIFPARLCMAVDVKNTGDVPLSVKVTDPNFCLLVQNTPGVSFDPNAAACEVCGDPNTHVKNIDPNATVRWNCCILVNSAAAMRLLAQNDGGTDPNMFENTIFANGTLANPGAGVCAGSGVQTTCTATIKPPPPCAFTVTKDVECDSDPNTFRQHANVLPGGQMTFRVRVQNTSAFVKLPHLCITDLLTDPNWAASPLGCAATMSIGPTSVTTCVCPTFNVTGARGCFTFAACRPATPWLAPGETLTLTYNIKAPLGGTIPTPCPHTTPDVTNTVTVEGYTEACPLTPDPNTACSKQTAFADVRKLVPAITCSKDVRADFNNDGTYETAFDPNLIIACDANFPMTLQWRVTATNPGEVNLTNVRVCDDKLIADATAAGLTIVSCDLGTAISCDGQSQKCKALANLAPCGGTASALCAIRIPSRAAWLTFTSQTGCYPNTAVVCGDASDPNVCVFGATTGVTSSCSANVCIRPPCNITVDKKARCLVSCNDPNSGFGTFVDGPLSVVPGAGVEYQITICNTDGTGFSPTDCAFRITDLMDPNKLDLIPSYQIKAKVMRGATTLCTFTPSCFNINGTPCIVTPPVACNPLASADCLVITFGACVRMTATGTITNNVTVEGAADCPAAGPVFCCSASDSLTLSVKRASLVCLSKKWSVLWDKNADCLLTTAPPDGFIDYSDFIDLETADGGKAIVFPAKLCMQVTVNNSGEVPLKITVTDPNFCSLVNSTPGVHFDGTCEVCQVGATPPAAKIVQPGANGVWNCCIRVDNAQAMRQLALNDGGSDPNMFENRAIATGIVVADTSGACVPPEQSQTPITDSGTDCFARIHPPPPCQVLVTKQVMCINCTTGFPEPNNPANVPSDTLTAGPGSCVRFIITARNTSAHVRIPRVRVEDDMAPPNWLLNGTCRARLDGVTDPNQICPTFNVNSVLECYTFGWRAGTPWIDPNEALTITFDVQVPPDFAVVGQNPDLSNVVIVEAFSEVCEPNLACLSPNDIPCSEGTDTSTVNVEVPAIACDKELAADYGNDGTIDVPMANVITIDEKDPNFAFPIRVVYTYTVHNTGEVPLKNVQVCDPILVCAAFSVGVTIQNCGLCTGACDCVNDNCATIPTLAVGASATVNCEIVIADKVQLLALLAADADGRPFYFTNIMNVSGLGDFSGLCTPAADIPVQATCTASLHFVPKISCPKTKAKAWIWNGNEIMFSGTERCVVAWEDRLLTRWTADMAGAPNSFPQTMLQTDKGQARIEGMESIVCPSSVNAPMLGISTRILDIRNDPNRIDFVSAPLFGAGTEVGQLIMLSSTLAAPHPVGHSDLAQVTNATTAEASLGAAAATIGSSPSGTAKVRSGSNSTLADVPVASITQPGSLLAYLLVEIKWDAAGNVIQDTFITLNNDFDAPVTVMVFQIDGEPSGYPTVCQSKIDNSFVLTANETAYWSALTGQPKNVSPFTVVAFRQPDPDPRNPGGTHAHGYMLIWAVDASNQEIRWNHLYGGATIVNYKYREASEYNAWTFQGLSSPNNGDLLSPPFGVLDLNGVEYSWMPSNLLLDFFAPGATLLSADGRRVTVIDTSLTLWIGLNDYTQGE